MTREEAITVPAAKGEPIVSMKLNEKDVRIILGNILDNVEFWEAEGKEAEKQLSYIAGLLDMAVAALREQEERQWISVDRNPKEKGCYVVTVNHWLDGKPVAREAYWNGSDWLSCEKKQEITLRVTHWMPLPEPPKEDA